MLRDLTLRVPATPGLTVLTGDSGSGKTTVLELLAGLRLPHTGAVSSPPTHLATQRPLVVSGTVGDNLRLSAPATEDEAVVRALREVGLWAALESRDGLGTRVGDDGFGLSAGQRTRPALARAMLSPAPVVLLNEPTPHVAESSLPQIHSVIARLARAVASSPPRTTWTCSRTPTPGGNWSR